MDILIVSGIKLTILINIIKKLEMVFIVKGSCMRIKFLEILNLILSRKFLWVSKKIGLIKNKLKRKLIHC
jgi:hypothetical protein